MVFIFSEVRLRKKIKRKSPPPHPPTHQRKAQASILEFRASQNQRKKQNLAPLFRPGRL